MKKYKISPKVSAIALAATIFWGMALMILTLISCYTGYAEGFLKLITTIYIGYNISPAGSIVGFIYGFLDAFIGVHIFAALYYFIYKRIS